jgi:hypothetical protein
MKTIMQTIDSVLRETDGWLTALQISNQTGMEVGQVARQIYDMHKAGDVERKKVPNTTRKSGAPTTVYAYRMSQAGSTECNSADKAAPIQAINLDDDRLERVAHVLRGCGLDSLKDCTASDDLQTAVAALAGAYQMALERIKEVRELNASLTESLGESTRVSNEMRQINEKIIGKKKTDSYQMGWLCAVHGQVFESQAEARQAAEEYCTQHPDPEQCFVAAIVAEATPITAVKWVEA